MRAVLWAWAAWHVAGILSRLPGQPVWLYDWNVYHAGAVQLLERTLYRVPLVEPGFDLPLSVFNLGPLAAVWAVPFLPLGREAGGVAFVLVSIAAVVVGISLSLRTLGVRQAWGAVIVCAYLLAWPLVSDQLGLANINDLMFAIVAAFAWAHVAGHQRIAGVLLAVAIGTKVWPVALVLLLLRERRWPELRAMAWTLVAVFVGTVAWLGPDVILAIAHAVIGANGPRFYPDIPQLWTSAARQWWTWWPAWGTYVVAAMLMAVPVRGRLGLGIGILAGLSLNANLWYHYVWVFGLGLALFVVGLRHREVPHAYPAPSLTPEPQT